jgi:hypothetical protein
MPGIPESRRPRSRRSVWDLMREVWKQFFGSDIETGYTYIYTWLANQFGHFMIGFAGTLLCSWLVALLWPFVLRPETLQQAAASAVIAVGWLLVWIILKELLYDVASALRDLRFAGRQRDALLADPQRKAHRDRRVIPNSKDLRDVWAALRDYYLTRRRQPPGETAQPEDWFTHDIVRDSEIDGWFYFSGVTTALMMYIAPLLAKTLGWPRLEGALPILTFSVLLVLSIPLSAGWLWGNIAFDKAMLPFVSRFALNSRPPREETRKRVLDFATLREGQPGHLVVIGPPKSGRTTTAVALGVEALLRCSPPREIVVYTTLCKLLDRVAEEQMPLPNYDQQGPPGKRPVWPPEEAQLLIVDDLGALARKETPLLTAEAFQTVLQKNEPLRATCDGKCVIWVVSDDPRRSEDWMNALKTAFKKAGSRVEPRVEDVVLATTIPAEEWRRPMRRTA